MMLIPPGAMFALSAEGVRAPDELPDNYAFVANVSRLVGAARFALAPGHHLRRANATEAAEIRAILQRQPSPVITVPWEHSRPVGGPSQPLPEAEWRYFVVGFRGSNDTVAEIEEVFGLTTFELKIAFTVVTQMIGGRPCSGVLSHPSRLFQLLEAAVWGRLPFLDITESEVAQIAEILGKLGQHDHSLVDVKRLARQLLDLEALPPTSPLRFLGYFATLESLLTHRPNQSDPYDSITRQVKKKLALLDHRWQPNIDYGPFAGARPDTIWAKMYEYRSSLAHGDAPSFENEFQTLGNHDNAVTLVRQTVKAVIRQALVEPRLIADLRDC